MTHIFNGFFELFVVLCMDDLLIFIMDKGVHYNHIAIVLCKVKSIELYVALKKGEFFEENIDSLVSSLAKMVIL